MKNPFSAIKHLIQDPVKNSDEIDQRKKKIIPLFLVALAIPVILIVVSLIADLSFLTFVGIFALIIALFYFLQIFSVMKKMKEKFKVFLCDGCQTQADFSSKPEDLSKYVTFEVLKEDSDTSVHASAPNDRGIIPSIKATINSTALVKITITCPKCGKKKSFKYSFKTFECQRTESNIRVKDAVTVKTALQDKLDEILAVYESEQRDTIPFSVYSKHHPNFENRFKVQLTGEEYKSFIVKYHVSIDEMVERFILGDDISGNIITD